MSKAQSPRKVDDKSALALATQLRTGTRKLNLVAQMIRGKSASDALYILTFTPRRIAGEVKKVLQSAIANAENNHALDVDRLVVTEASVGQAMMMKRFATRGRGKSTRIEKPFSRLRIIVSEQASEDGKKKAAPKTAAKAEKKSPAKQAAKPAAKKAKQGQGE